MAGRVAAPLKGEDALGDGPSTRLPHKQQELAATWAGQRHQTSVRTPARPRAAQEGKGAAMQTVPSHQAGRESCQIPKCEVSLEQVKRGTHGAR